MDFKNRRMIEYWCILFLICETVFIQALKHAHLVRIISGILALCTVHCDSAVTITCVYVTARQTNLTTCSDMLDIFATKIFRVARLFFRRVRETERSD